jgi:hypothetical protein
MARWHSRGEDAIAEGAAIGLERGSVQRLVELHVPKEAAGDDLKHRSACPARTGTTGRTGATAFRFGAA